MFIKTGDAEQILIVDGAIVPEEVSKDAGEKMQDLVEEIEKKKEGVIVEEAKKN
jgi:hypothetical protein